MTDIIKSLWAFLSTIWLIKLDANVQKKPFGFSL